MGRQIEAKMVGWIDKKLAGNGSAAHAIEAKDARSLFVYAMEACVGIREEGGPNRGVIVSLIQDTVDGPDHVAWCMSLVQTCIAYAEVKTGVKSPLAASEHCLTTWRKSPKSSRVKTFPARGAVVIWQHGSSEAGHTGVFLESLDGGKTMFCVEGNTGGGITAGGSVEREGDGVYLTKRNMSGTGSMKVVGFLKPF